MGYILSELGKKDDALRCYDMALELNPNYFVSWHNKGLIYEDLGELANAEECYANALNIDPKVALSMGDNLYKHEKHEEALKWFDKYLLRVPNDLAGLTNKGLVLRSLKRMDESLLQYDKALSIDPNADQFGIIRRSLCGI